MTTGFDLKHLRLHAIARLIEQDWKKVNFAARPYLDAMKTLDSVQDSYYADTGDMIVRYFLGNAGAWRGETAREVKAELKRRIA